MLINRNKTFDCFVKKFIPLSAKYDILNVNHASTYDAYIAGSDMLWHWHTTSNGEFFDSTYFLDFVKDNKKKYSYAASFGTDDIKQEFYSYYKSALQNFSLISVRELSGVKLIQKILGRRSENNIDPTLLFTADQWREIEVKPSDSGYVLLYEVGGISDRMIFFAKRLARKKKKKLIVLLSEFDPFRYQGNFGLSPQEFLGMFDNAEYVITNSYHGAVFSLIFHKNFLVEINSWSKNSRAKELLERLQLEDRSLRDDSDITVPINWMLVDDKIVAMRDLSKKYLSKIVDN